MLQRLPYGMFDFYCAAQQTARFLLLNRDLKRLSVAEFLLLCDQESDHPLKPELFELLGDQDYISGEDFLKRFHLYLLHAWETLKKWNGRDLLTLHQVAMPNPPKQITDSDHLTEVARCGGTLVLGPRVSVLSARLTATLLKNLPTPLCIGDVQQELAKLLSSIPTEIVSGEGREQLLVSLSQGASWKTETEITPTEFNTKQSVISTLAQLNLELHVSSLIVSGIRTGLQKRLSRRQTLRETLLKRRRDMMKSSTPHGKRMFRILEKKRDRCFAADQKHEAKLLELDQAIQELVSNISTLFQRCAYQSLNDSHAS